VQVVGPQKPKTDDAFHKKERKDHFETLSVVSGTSTWTLFSAGNAVLLFNHSAA
jgi:hypothetical protein